VGSISVCCQSKEMPSLCEDALSPIHVPAKFLGIRLSEKCPFLLRAWGLAFQLFFFLYTLNEALQRWHLIAKAPNAMSSSETIAAIFDTVHGAYFIVLVIVIVHFNRCKNIVLFDIFSLCAQVSAKLNCGETIFRRFKLKMLVLSAFMNTAILFLYLCDYLTWFYTTSFLHMLQSNVITATWVTCELVFLSVVYLTHQLYSHLNSKIVVNSLNLYLLKNHYY
jgi:hypothetical protein